MNNNNKRPTLNLNNDGILSKVKGLFKAKRKAPLNPRNKVPNYGRAPANFFPLHTHARVHEYVNTSNKSAKKAGSTRKRVVKEFVGFPLGNTRRPNINAILNRTRKNKNNEV